MKTEVLKIQKAEGMFPSNEGSNMIKLLLDLALELNSNFLAAEDLDDIINAVLVGITAGEGLGFNRSIFFEYDIETDSLRGRLAVGPSDRDEAGEIWNDIEDRNLSLFDILDKVKENLSRPNSLLKRIREIKIPLALSATLSKCISEKRAIHIKTEGCHVCSTFCFCRQLGSEESVIVPLYARDEIFGLIFADNFVTGKPITPDDINALHLFACLASMAAYQVRMSDIMCERLREREILNQELEENRDRLVATERYTALGRMSDQLLHEIRNPFSVIGGMAKILERKNEDTSLDSYISTIISHSARIEQSLENLSEFVDLPELIKEPVYVCQLVRASVDLLKSEMDRHHIAWHLSMPDDDMLIFIDRNHIQQALLNVMRNSIEAMADGGMLIVAVKEKNDICDIRITDTGLGIAKGHIKKADEPFFTTKTHSMGLGLSLAKRTVAMHKGRLQILKNRIGGATAIIEIPCKETS